MEKQAEYNRTKAAERVGRLKAWKGISMRPKFLIVAVLFLITLLAAKIIVSGLYLHFDALKIPVMNIAMAEENGVKQAAAKETDTKQAETKQSAATDLTVTAANLKKKEQELKDREAVVLKKEQELAPLQAEVDAKIEQLNELQVKLTAMAKEIAEKEQGLKDEKVNQLVTMYSAMDAAKAAKIMDKLNLDTVVKILANMKPKSAGPILAAMSTDKGAVISERLSNME
jgi:flagellar motility protein MotE (MotC chaperone)